MSRQSRKPDLDAEIDANLKRAFEDLANEPVPDRFTDLLNQLRSGGVKSAPKQGEQNGD